MDMNVIIRQERTTDFTTAFNLIKLAFKNDKISDYNEQLIVEELRKSTTFIPEFSLVAEFNNEIVGHILLTKINIKNNKQQFVSLALAPVSVLPKHQRKGIGGQLIKKAHQIAKKAGYKSIVVLGHENYYPKFGYQQAHKFGIKFPFKAPKENCMVVELIKNGLQVVSGTVEYPKEFYL